MPADFNNCRASGGKMRTISGPNKQFNLKVGEYMHICIKGNQVHQGEKKQKKELARKMGM